MGELKEGGISSNQTPEKERIQSKRKERKGERKREEGGENERHPADIIFGL